MVLDIKNKVIIDLFNWIKIKEVKENDIVKNFKVVIDFGEFEVIVFVFELDVDFIIIDEKKGWKIVEDYGLCKIGFFGILVELKWKGFIKEVWNLLE